MTTDTPNPIDPRRRGWAIGAWDDNGDIHGKRLADILDGIGWVLEADGDEPLVTLPASTLDDLEDSGWVGIDGEDEDGPWSVEVAL